MRRCQKAFIFLSIAVSQGGAAYPSLFLFSFGYDYLFFFYLREKRNKKKGNLLSERCGTTAAAAGQVSIATPCWPTTNCKNPTHKTNKNKRCRDISFHFFFLFSLFLTNNPTSLAKASDNVNHPYWFNAFLGFEFFFKKRKNSGWSGTIGEKQLPRAP